MIEREDLVNDPRFADNAARTVLKSGAAWKPVFEAWDAPWELIQTVEDLRVDPQVTANGMLFQMPVPDGSEVTLVAGPVAFDGKQMSSPATRAPTMGVHTAELLKSVGYSDRDIAALKASRVAQ